MNHSTPPRWAALAVLLLAGALAAAPAHAINVQSASTSTSWEMQSTPVSQPVLDLIRSRCTNAASCEFAMSEVGLSDRNQKRRIEVAYDCGDGRRRWESMHWAQDPTAVLRLTCWNQPAATVTNLPGTPHYTPLLPNFYRDNVNGRNIAALATPSTSSSPLGLINSAANLVPIPNPYAELGSVIMGLFSRPSVKYYLPRLAASDGRIVLQMDDGSWCHVRNPTAYSVVDTGWFFTPTSRNDVPAGANIPFCPMPDGFYKVSGNHGSAIYYLGYTAPGGWAPLSFYNIQFSSGYCVFANPGQQLSITAAKIGVPATEAGVAPTVFHLGDDGNIAEGRQFMGTCDGVSSPHGDSGWVGRAPSHSGPPAPGWMMGPSSDVDHLRRLLYFGSDRQIGQLNAMSADDVRNTAITVLSNDTAGSVGYYQGLDNRNLAGIAFLRLYVKGGGVPTTTTSPDNVRNTAIVMLANTGRWTTQQLAAMDNFSIYQNVFR